MLCPFCGKEIPDDILFCPECGSEISEELRKKARAEKEKAEAEQKRRESQNKTEQEPVQETDYTGRRSGKKKKTFFIALAGAVVAVGAIGFTLKNRNQSAAPAAAPVAAPVETSVPEENDTQELQAETEDSEVLNQAAEADDTFENSAEEEISTGFVIVNGIGTNAYVRADAGTGFSKVGTAEGGVVYPVVGSKSDEKGMLWYCIELPDGMRGYIRSDFAQYSLEAPTVERVEIDWPQEIQKIAGQEREASSAMADGQYRYDEGGLTILSASLMSLADLADQEEESVLEKYQVQAVAEVLLDEYEKGYKTYWSNLFDQDPWSALYKELNMLAEEGGTLADRLDNSVFELDTSLLHERQAALKEAYREKYILRFNRFTEQATWSRSESWEVMSDAHEAELINDSKLDDPLRLRYCYAMAMVNRKTNTNAVAEKKITKAEAIENLLDVLEATDYNPTILYDCWKYADEIGDSRADEFYELYTDIIGRIRDTQDYKVDPEHFWYFNDFENYSVSPTNGVTVENRRWIRDYMQSKGY